MISRKDFRAMGTTGVMFLGILAGQTKTTKDDEAVKLISRLFTEEDTFADLCDLLEIPEDAPPPA